MYIFSAPDVAVVSLGWIEGNNQLDFPMLPPVFALVYLNFLRLPTTHPPGAIHLRESGAWRWVKKQSLLRVCSYILLESL